MVLENFYEITNKEIFDDKNTYSFTIGINKDHPIFQGHFPNNPVMPGVCMMQIIKEITEEIIQKNLFMEKCSNVKFMALINPNINSVLNLELQIFKEEEVVKVKNVSKFDDTIALKLTAYYRIVES